MNQKGLTMKTTTKNAETHEHGVRWLEFDRRTDRLVTKERVFRSAAAMDRFIEKLPDRPRFYAFDAFLP